MASNSTIQGAGGVQQNDSAGTSLNGSSVTGLQNSTTGDQLTQASPSTLAVIGPKQEAANAFPVVDAGIIALIILGLILAGYSLLSDAKK
jgi:hypothetical protein